MVRGHDGLCCATLSVRRGLDQSEEQCEEQCSERHPTLPRTAGGGPAAPSENPLTLTALRRPLNERTPVFAVSPVHLKERLAREHARGGSPGGGQDGGQSAAAASSAARASAPGISPGVPWAKIVIDPPHPE